ncbi:hypothetical protein CONPUDRAFT_52791 [Coniophora puteana RWD-64-598 SS2]|uniref:Methyltransferase domain-containing protein n=1 Tax=Coniophora puteana (strain RWD-64-598) TaxID=741705 RepID=A0A5M3MVZ2_CONPW|nr:uncharacterized protein CONPUDRAFT_52791 [Coniophora puteana RWD-64-598 SS2]EIW83332.1 hypothetical protein CONPUDRAFT_52791 [Coniophora puteana RWD-64-598 SS2]
MSTSGNPPLDERFYSLQPDEAEFFKDQTGIGSDEELKKHVLQVQAKAYEVHPYSCIMRFSFTSLRISRLPAYSHALKLGRERPGAIFLDLGCCFGNDARKAVADGFPVENVIGSDLHKEFWELGHELFKTTPQTFAAAFVPGDVFEMLEPVPIPLPAAAGRESSDLKGSSSGPGEARPGDLRTLTSLAPLRGHVSVIHTSAFFHLFGEEQQRALAARLVGLLSAEPGSVIFGIHGGLRVAGERERQTPGKPRVFSHSPDSWRELWDGQVFEKGTVRVEAELLDATAYLRPDLSEASVAEKRYWLQWSVTRL